MKMKMRSLNEIVAVLIMYIIALCILFGLIEGVKSFNKVWIGEPVVQSGSMTVLVKKIYSLDKRTEKLIYTKLLGKKDYIPVGYIQVTTLKPSLKEQAAARVALSRAKEMGADNVLLINTLCKVRSKFEARGMGIGGPFGGYSKSRIELVRTYIYTFVALKKR